MFGYTGKILRVNLTTKEITVEAIADQVYEAYIGGAGMAAKIVYEETDENTDPLGPENVLVAYTGPFTGTLVPSSSRHHLAARSPQTGVYGESNVGGSWGVQLKKAGFDGVVVTGKAENPVYLWIHNEQYELRDAAQIWGMDSIDSTEWLKEQTHKRATAAVIGQAGENLVKFAGVPHLGKVMRLAGRTGMGAVMGSKNLKAMVAYGTLSIEIADPKALQASVKANMPHLTNVTKAFKQYGTAGGVDKYENMGNFPIKNWHGSRWDKATKISGVTMHDTILIGRHACRGCVISCGRHVEVTEGKYAPMNTEGPEYETVGTFGGECLIDDLAAIVKANDLCNRYGLDSITAGATVAFAMEAYERGIINKEDTDGLALEWGDADAMIELLHRITFRKNIGDVLSLGSAGAAKALGKNATEFAVHVKGLEPSAHDPRRFWTHAVGYMTSARGACHNRTAGHFYELGGVSPEIGIEKSPRSYEMEGLVEVVSNLQNYQSFNDSLVLCRFDQVGHAVSASNTMEWYKLVTGLEIDAETMLKTGERIFTLKRMFNTRAGVSRKDDFLPLRFMTHNRKGENLTNQLPPAGQMLNEYYEHRGWDELGIPQEEKMAELGLA